MPHSKASKPRPHARRPTKHPEEKGDPESAAPKPLPPRRLALLICNGSFPKIPNQLAGPAKDAERLREILSEPEACGFNVSVLVDRGLLEVRREIARLCAAAGREDTLLIYYSGNGLEATDGTFCLLVADSESDFLEATALDADFILSRLRCSRCRKIVLLIDACHAGAFFAQNRGVPNGLYAVTSCGAAEMCADTPEGGVFTMALCAGLRGGAADTDQDGSVSIDELHDWAKRWVAARNYLGVPQKWVWNVQEPIAIANVPRPVFLSYAHEDEQAAMQLKEALQAEGLSVWIDQKDVQSGSWKDRVIDGLNRSRAFVVLLTEASLASEAVRKELALASSEKVPIIPALPAEIPDRSFSGWYKFDYGELHRHILPAASYKEAVAELASAIRALRRTPDVSEPAAAQPAAAGG